MSMVFQMCLTYPGIKSCSIEQIEMKARCQWEMELMQADPAEERAVNILHLIVNLRANWAFAVLCRSHHRSQRTMVEIHIGPYPVAGRQPIGGRQVYFSSSPLFYKCSIHERIVDRAVRVVAVELMMRTRLVQG